MIALIGDVQIDQAKVRLRALASSDSLRHGDFTVFDREARASIAAQDGWILLRPLDRDMVLNTRLEAGQRPPKTPILPEVAAQPTCSGKLRPPTRWP